MVNNFMIGIYCIENKVDGKKYIGQSSNIRKRFESHKKFLKLGIHKNKHLQYAWDKYGDDNFIFWIMCECGEEEIDDLERIFIALYKSNDEKHGYNLTSGGNKYSKHSPETIEKIRAWNTGRKHTEETKAKLRGRKMSREQIEKMLKTKSERVYKSKKGMKYKHSDKFFEKQKAKISQNS